MGSNEGMDQVVEGLWFLFFLVFFPDIAGHLGMSEPSVVVIKLRGYFCGGVETGLVQFGLVFGGISNLVVP